MGLRLDRRRRRQLREIASIVLGVLIALGLGEVADAVRWAVRVDTGMAAIRTELGGNRFNLAERALLQPCIDRRLAAIGRVLEDARASGQLPILSPIGLPPERPIENAAYDVAEGQGLFLHMNGGDARDVALAYLTVADDYRSAAQAERAAWSELRMIEGNAGSVDSDTLLALRQALNAARGQSERIRVLIDRADGLLETSGVPIEYGRYRRREALVAELRQSAMCRPLAITRG